MLGLFIRIARMVAEEADRQMYDPSVIKQQLGELERRFDRGELDEHEFERLEDELLERLEHRPKE